jgi:DNA-binding HxlR family transcriptional regulator
MSRREYDQPCSIADALDRIGERWSLLVIRELLLGPLRFSDLVRAMGGPPTDVLTKRLREFEDCEIVVRRELGPPASCVIYELTDLGRELEPMLIEMGRWGLNFYVPKPDAELAPSWLPNSLRVILQAPADLEATVQLHSDGEGFAISIAGGWVNAQRGEMADPDLVLSGPPRPIIAGIVVGEQDLDGVEVEGDRDVFAALHDAVVLPDRLREGAQAAIDAIAAARTA